MHDNHVVNAIAKAERKARMSFARYVTTIAKESGALAVVRALEDSEPLDCAPPVYHSLVREARLRGLDVGAGL